MLDKTSRLVINRFVEHESDWKDNNGVIPEDSYWLMFPEAESLDDCIDYLENAGLLKSSRYGGDGPRYGVYLTHEGRHFKEFGQLTKREKWGQRIWGIVAGVVIGVSSTLICQAIIRAIER